MERNNSPNYFFLIAIVAIVAVAGILVMIMQPSTQSSNLAGQGAKLQLGGGGETNAPVPISEGKLSSYNEIKTCGRTITKPGTYTLKNDLTCSGDGIIVDVNPSQYPDGIVYLNGNGKTITGPGTNTGQYNGIKILEGNIEINNIEITSFKNGVRILSGNLIINGGVFSDSVSAILASLSATLNINNGLFSNNINGIYANDTVVVTINGGTFSDNGNHVRVYKNSALLINEGTFLDSSGTSVVVGSFVEAQIYGGSICGETPYGNIHIWTGGSVSGYGAHCNSVWPEGAYDCLPCDQIR